MKQTTSIPRLRWIIASLVLVVAAVTTTVVAQTMGQAEKTDAGHSWPHEVMGQVQQNGQPVNRSMNDLLTEIHGIARSRYDGETQQNRVHINKIIAQCLRCLAYDGNMDTPGQAHSSAAGGQVSHFMAAQNVINAWQALNPMPTVPPTPLDWALAAGELEHGH